MARTAVLGVAMLAAGCFPNDGELVSNTTTTGYTTAGTERPRPTAGCTTDLHPFVHFDHQSAALTDWQRGELVQWATCLNRPGMRDESVVLTGGRDPDPNHPVFEMRAAAIKNELATYGVDASRIIVGTPNAMREGGKLGPSDAVALELTHRSLRKNLR